jgi:hypothetical protein
MQLFGHTDHGLDASKVSLSATYDMMTVLATYPRTTWSRCFFAAAPCQRLHDSSLQGSLLLHRNMFFDGASLIALPQRHLWQTAAYIVLIAETKRDIDAIMLTIDSGEPKLMYARLVTCRTGPRVLVHNTSTIRCCRLLGVLRPDMRERARVKKGFLR